MLSVKKRARPDYRKWTEEAMSAAVTDVKTNGLSIRKAAAKYSVPPTTLNNRTTGKIQEGAKWGRAPLLSKADEEGLLENAKKRAELGVGYSKHNFLRCASELAKRRGAKFKRSLPSEMWWRRLKRRSPEFTLRTPESTSALRHQGMTRQRIQNFFAVLNDVYSSQQLHCKPMSIWNMDETGITMSHKPGKVLAQRGAKTVHGKSGSREMVTVIACANAAGTTIPPHFIMPGKTKRALQGYGIENLPKDSVLKDAKFSVSESGWTKDGIVRLWFEQTFLPNIGSDRPQLLICDGHGSHNNIEFIEIARSNNIVVMELPSHTSNWTQPLDRSFFKSLKSGWNKEVDTFISTTGVSIGHAQFLKVFEKAWSMSIKRI